MPWSEDDERWGRKVGYITLDGYETTAYLNANPGGGDIYTGVNKHTDEPVTVYWTGTQYIEQQNMVGEW